MRYLCEQSQWIISSIDQIVVDKWINKFKYKKDKQNRLNKRNAWLWLINWLLNHIIKLIAGTDVYGVEKLVFFNLGKSQVIKFVFEFLCYRFHALIDFDLNECFPQWVVSTSVVQLASDLLILVLKTWS